MRNILIMLSVILLSAFMVGASAMWFMESQGLLSGLSLLIAVGSFFFNVSGAIYLAEGTKLKSNISVLTEPAGKITVAIPVKNPDLEVLEKSIQSIKKMEYFEGIEIYVLDDSKGGKAAKSVKTLCRKLNAELLHRDAPKGGKAGALNAFLLKTDADFLAVFDGDEVVENRFFLMETMGHFWKKGVAFVQTNKMCGGDSLFERAANYTNAAFVNLIQPINTRKGVGLFTGSCGIFRVSALHDVGGFPESLIEDIAISLKLLWKGWESEHIPKVYAVGGAIDSFTRFAKQHMRYISGITTLLPEYARNVWKFGLEQKIILVVHALGLHYVSLVQIIACIVAVIAVVNGSFLGEAASAAYLISMLTTLIFLSKAYSGSIKMGLFAYLLNFSVVVPRIIASLGALVGRRLIGGKMLLVSALIQLIVGAVLIVASIFMKSVALFWWGVLFLSNPYFLYSKR